MTVHIPRQRQLENVAIANALQLEDRSTSRQFPIRFNYDEVYEPIRCRLVAFLLLIRYVML